jgi:integrase
MAHIDRREGRKKQYRVHWIDRFTGQRRNKSFEKRKQAQAFLETIGSQENTTSHSHPNATVTDAMNRWYTLSTTTGRSGRPPVEKSTYTKYAHHKKIILQLIGHKKLCELSKKDCNEFRDILLERYSRTYARKFLTSFKSALEQAVTDELIGKSPATDTTIYISKREVMANRVTIPDMHEITRLTKTIDRLMQHKNGQKREAWQRYGAFFYTMLYTGLRPSEMRGLAWSSIDWQKNRISVERRADADGILGSLKSAAAYRTISVAAIVMDKLKDWQQQCPQSPDDLVFPNFRGNVESLSNITNRGWYVLCREAGLSYSDDNGKERANYNLYALRHTKASIEIALNRSPKRIQTLMGHANIKLTFDTYGHLFEDESLQDDPNDMDDLINRNVLRASKNDQNTDINERI